MKTCITQHRRVTPVARRPFAKWFAATATACLLLVNPMCATANAATALNLSSTSHNVSAPSAATIIVGGKTVAVQAGAMITPAELVAVDQILQSGHQQLIIGQAGNAVRGMFTVNGIGGALSSLTIPRGVTALDNFTNSNLILSGDYTNAGKFYAYSTSPSSPNAVIQALDIINQRGGLISSSLPAGNFGLNNVISSLNLNMAAANNFVNHGSIVSSGNVNISNLNGNNLTINNSGGTIQALGQSITVDSTQFSQNSNVTLFGGNWLSNQLNVNAGNGSIVIDVKNITGVLNTQASSVLTQASTPNLQIGSIDVTGDPTFYNTTGNITISSPLTVVNPGDSLAFVASGSIVSTGGSIDISNPAGNAGNITMIAGAKFTTNGPTQVLPPIGDTASTLKITGGSSTGGLIDIHNISALNASSATANGGNITLVAFAGSSGGSGTIRLPSSFLVNTTGGGATGTNGNVLMIAGAASGTAITVGGINANGGGTTTGGNIGLFAAKPVLTNASITDGKLTGTISAGAATGGGISFIDTVLPVAVTAGGTFTASAGGAIDTTKANITSAGNLGITSTGSTVTAGSIKSSAGAVTLSAGNTLSLTKPVVASGDITLATTAKNGNLLIQDNIVSTGTGSISASTNGTGSIEMLNQVIAKAPVTGGINSFPVGAAPMPDGKFVFVPDNSKNIVYILDTSTNTVVGTVTAGAFPFSSPQGTAMAPETTPGTGTLYVGNYASQNINVVAISDSAGVTASVSTSYAMPVDAGTGKKLGPEAIAVSGDGSKLYIVSDVNSTFGTPGPEFFTVMDAATGTVIKTIPLGTNLQQTGGVVLNPQGTLAYVTNSGSKAVSVIDLTTNTVAKTIDLSSFGVNNPVSAAIDPNGTRLYVSEGSVNQGTAFATGQIAIIDALPTSKTFETVIGTVKFANGNINNAAGGAAQFPQGITTTATGVEVLTQTTYGFNTIPNTTVLYANSTPQATVGVTTGTGTDGIGSSNWSTVVTTPAGANPNPINNLTSFTGDTYNFQTSPQTISVVREPTMQGHNISLKSGGFVLGSYDALGGTLTVNATGKNSQVIISNVGTAPSVIGNSKSTGLFELGSLGSLTVAGSVASPNIMIQATANNSNIQLGNLGTAAKVGQAGGSVLLSANGSGTITQGNSTSNVMGKNVTFNTATGDIGATGPNNAINTTTPNIAVTTGKQAFINNIGAVTIGPSNAALFSLTNTGNITYNSTGSIDALSINLATTSGSILVNAAIGLGIGLGSSVSLTAGGTGAIVQASGTSLISADSITLDAAKGNIGSASQSIRTTTPLLDINTHGQAFVSNTGNVVLNQAFNGSGFSLTNTGAIIVAQPIAAKTLTLNATGGAASTIALDENVGMTGANDTITATGGITEASGKIVTGNSLVIKSQGGDIGSAVVPIATSVTNMTVSAFGTNVFLTDSTTGQLTLSNGSTSVNYATFSLKTDGNLVNKAVLGGINNTLTAAGNITVNAGISGLHTVLDAGIDITGATTSNGGILVSKGIVVGSGSLGGTTDVITAHGTGTIMNTNSSGFISDTINVSSDKGSIGSKSIPFLFITLTLNANSTNSSANLLDVGTGVALTLAGSTAGAMTLTTRGSSLTCGLITVGSATTKGNNLTIVQQGGSSSGTGGITLSGAIGVTNGNVNITNQGSGAFSTSGGVSTIIGAGPSALAIGGGVSLVQQGNGAMSINGNVNAHGGNIVLQDTNTSFGAINLGTTATTTISTTVANPSSASGTITIAIGKVPVTPQNGGQANFPSGTTVTPTGNGNAFAGSNPTAIVFKAGATVATLNATNTNILFNSPSASNKITFGNMLTITADPPAPAAPTVVPPVHFVPMTAASNSTTIQQSRSTAAGSTSAVSGTQQNFSGSIVPVSRFNSADSSNRTFPSETQQMLVNNDSPISQSSQYRESRVENDDALVVESDQDSQ